jgi:hypothetical protein
MMSVQRRGSEVDDHWVTVSALGKAAIGRAGVSTIIVALRDQKYSGTSTAHIDDRLHANWFDELAKHTPNILT